VEINEPSLLQVRPEHIIDVIAGIEDSCDLIFATRPIVSAISTWLGKRVIGQHEGSSRRLAATEAEQGATQGKLSQAGWGAPLPGPTGGKTELAKAVAETMFGDEQRWCAST
jgi:ATP-dependent Clp protease ATP-binding subunit ClpA